MKRICLSAEQAIALANGATELRVPVKPQPWCNKFGTWVWQPDTAWHRRYPQHFFSGSTAEELARCMLLPKPSICPYPVGSTVALTETFHLSLQGASTPPGFIRTLQYENITRGLEVPIPPTRYEWFDRLTQSDNRYCWMMRPAITMPAKLSRFKRRVKAVRVEHGTEWEWVLELEVA